MLARKCDCCGKLYEIYRGSEVPELPIDANAVILADRKDNNSYYGRKILDLCPECMAELQDFLKCVRKFPVEE